MKRFVGMGNVRVSAASLPARCSHTDIILGREVRCPAPCAPFKAVCPAHALPALIKEPPHLDKKVKADLKDWYRKYLHKEEGP